MKTVLSVKDLIISRGGWKLNYPLHFDLKSGELVAILGNNGVGKTTLLKTLVRQYHPISGKIDIFVPQVKYLEQNNYVEKSIPMTLKEWLSFGFGQDFLYQSSLTKEQEIKLQEVSQIYQLKSKLNYYISDISGGEFQRSILCRMELLNPDLYLLDEPATYLDLNSQKLFFMRMRQLGNEGRTVICITHDWLQSLEYFDKFIILNEDNFEFISREVLRNKLNDQLKGDV